MSTETIRLIRDGEMGEKVVWRWGKRESIYIYLSLHKYSSLVNIVLNVHRNHEAH